MASKIEILKRTIALIEKAKVRNQATIDIMSGSRHPTHIQMSLEAKAKLETYNEILEALNGDFITLRISAGE